MLFDAQQSFTAPAAVHGHPFAVRQSIASPSTRSGVASAPARLGCASVPTPQRSFCLANTPAPPPPVVFTQALRTQSHFGTRQPVAVLAPVRSCSASPARTGRPVAPHAHRCAPLSRSASDQSIGILEAESLNVSGYALGAATCPSTHSSSLATPARLVAAGAASGSLSSQTGSILSPHVGVSPRILSPAVCQSPRMVSNCSPSSSSAGRLVGSSLEPSGSAAALSRCASAHSIHTVPPVVSPATPTVGLQPGRMDSASPSLVSPRPSGVSPGGGLPVPSSEPTASTAALPRCANLHVAPTFHNSFGQAAASAVAGAVARPIAGSVAAPPVCTSPGSASPRPAGQHSSDRVWGTSPRVRPSAAALSRQSSAHAITTPQTTAGPSAAATAASDDVEASPGALGYGPCANSVSMLPDTTSPCLTSPRSFRGDSVVLPTSPYSTSDRVSVATTSRTISIEDAASRATAHVNAAIINLVRASRLSSGSSLSPRDTSDVARLLTGSPRGSPQLSPGRNVRRHSSGEGATKAAIVTRRNSHGDRRVGTSSPAFLRVCSRRSNAVPQSPLPLSPRSEGNTSADSDGPLTARVEGYLTLPAPWQKQSGMTQTQAQHQHHPRLRQQQDKQESKAQRKEHSLRKQQFRQQRQQQQSPQCSPQQYPQPQWQQQPCQQSRPQSEVDSQPQQRQQQRQQQWQQQQQRNHSVHIGQHKQPLPEHQDVGQDQQRQPHHQQDKQKTQQRHQTYVEPMAQPDMTVLQQDQCQRQDQQQQQRQHQQQHQHQHQAYPKVMEQLQETWLHKRKHQRQEQQPQQQRFKPQTHSEPIVQPQATASHQHHDQRQHQQHQQQPHHSDFAAVVQHQGTSPHQDPNQPQDEQQLQSQQCRNSRGQPDMLSLPPHQNQLQEQQHQHQAHLGSMTQPQVIEYHQGSDQRQDQQQQRPGAMVQPHVRLFQQHDSQRHDRRQQPPHQHQSPHESTAHSPPTMQCLSPQHCLRPTSPLQHRHRQNHQEQQNLRHQQNPKDAAVGALGSAVVSADVPPDCSQNIEGSPRTATLSPNSWTVGFCNGAVACADRTGKPRGTTAVLPMCSAVAPSSWVVGSGGVAATSVPKPRYHGEQAAAPQANSTVAPSSGLVVSCGVAAASTVSPHSHSGANFVHQGETAFVPQANAVVAPSSRFVEPSGDAVAAVGGPREHSEPTTVLQAGWIIAPSSHSVGACVDAATVTIGPPEHSAPATVLQAGSLVAPSARLVGDSGGALVSVGGPQGSSEPTTVQTSPVMAPSPRLAGGCGSAVRLAAGLREQGDNIATLQMSPIMVPSPRFVGAACGSAVRYAGGLREHGETVATLQANPIVASSALRVAPFGGAVVSADDAREHREPIAVPQASSNLTPSAWPRLGQGVDRSTVVHSPSGPGRAGEPAVSIQHLFPQPSPYGASTLRSASAPCLARHTKPSDTHMLPGGQPNLATLRRQYGSKGSSSILLRSSSAETVADPRVTQRKDIGTTLGMAASSGARNGEHHLETAVSNAFGDAAHGVQGTGTWMWDAAALDRAGCTSAASLHSGGSQRLGALKDACSKKSAAQHREDALTHAARISPPVESSYTQGEPVTTGDRQSSRSNSPNESALSTSTFREHHSYRLAPLAVERAESTATESEAPRPASPRSTLDHREVEGKRGCSKLPEASAAHTQDRRFDSPPVWGSTVPPFRQAATHTVERGACRPVQLHTTDDAESSAAPRCRQAPAHVMEAGASRPAIVRTTGNAESSTIPPYRQAPSHAVEGEASRPVTVRAGIAECSAEPQYREAPAQALKGESSRPVTVRTTQDTPLLAVPGAGAPEVDQNAESSLQAKSFASRGSSRSPGSDRELLAVSAQIPVPPSGYSESDNGLKGTGVAPVANTSSVASGPGATTSSALRHGQTATASRRPPVAATHPALAGDTTPPHASAMTFGEMSSIASPSPAGSTNTTPPRDFGKTASAKTCAAATCPAIAIDTPPHGSRVFLTCTSCGAEASPAAVVEPPRLASAISVPTANPAMQIDVTLPHGVTATADESSTGGAQNLAGALHAAPSHSSGTTASMPSALAATNTAAATGLGSPRNSGMTSSGQSSVDSGSVRVDGFLDVGQGDPLRCDAIKAHDASPTNVLETLLEELQHARKTEASYQIEQKAISDQQQDELAAYDRQLRELQSELACESMAREQCESEARLLRAELQSLLESVDVPTAHLQEELRGELTEAKRAYEREAAEITRLKEEEAINSTAEALDAFWADARPRLESADKAAKDKQAGWLDKAQRLRAFVARGYKNQEHLQDELESLKAAFATAECVCADAPP